MHIDGAYGLPAASVRPDLFRGLERAGSVSVDAHKWLYLPKACGIVLVRQQEDLADAFAHEEGYLPHQQHELHAVDITFEYSRPFRALKLWLAMRAHGAQAFRDSIERNLGEAQLLYDQIGTHDDLEALGPPQLSIVAVPPRAERGRRPRTPTTSDWPRRSRPTAACRSPRHSSTATCGCDRVS